MSTIYVIADLHFGHEKVAIARKFWSTRQHDDAIVDAWNSVVTKRDVVYVLGDVFRLERLKDLLGIKKLALGNHDGNAVAYTEHFSQVRACFELDNCLLTHIPVHTNQFKRWEMNVHGHMHDGELSDSRYICVSAEKLPGMVPVPLRELIARRREQRGGTKGSIFQPTKETS